MHFDTAFPKKLLLSAVSLLLFALLAESIIRLSKIDTHSKNQFFIMNRDLDYPEVYKKDRQLFWRPHPNRVVTSRFFDGRTYGFNSLGLRTNEIINPRNKPRLIALGNSCTFGWGVADDEVFTAQLSQNLDNQYEVVNAGVPGYSSYQGRIFYENEISGLHPDILLILFAWNDQWLAANDIPDKEQKFPPEIIIGAQNLLSRLQTYRLLKKWLLTNVEKNSLSKYDRTNAVARVGLDDFYENLKSICQKAHNSRATPILLTSPIPSLEKYYLPGSISLLHRNHEYYNNVIRDLAKNENIKLIDLALEFDKYSGLFDDVTYDPIHFNARGHRLAAALIAQKLDSLKQ